jgi:hypothetical protein
MHRPVADADRDDVGEVAATTEVRVRLLTAA